MVNTLYIVEALLLCSTATGALLLTISQILAIRFTPKRKQNPTKVWMTFFTLISAIFQTVRTTDVNRAFRFWAPDAGHAMMDQMTCFLVYSCTVMLAASAKSLYAIINKRQPILVTICFITTAVAYHTSSTLMCIYESIVFNNHPTDTDLTNIVGYRAIIFEIMVTAILLSNWYTVLPLRNVVSKFAKQLKAQEEKIAINKASSPIQQNRKNSAPTDVQTSGAADISAADRADPSSTMPTRVTVEPVGGATGTAVAPASPGPTYTSSSATSSSSAARLADLEAAATKLHRLNLFITVCMLSAIATNTPRMEGFAHHNETLSNYELLDPETYEPIQFIYPFFQNASLYVLIYYAWTSPKNWMSSAARKEAGVDSFWRVIVQGLPEDDAGSVYAITRANLTANNTNVNAPVITSTKSPMSPKRELSDGVAEKKHRLERTSAKDQPVAADLVIRISPTNETTVVEGSDAAHVLPMTSSNEGVELTTVPGAVVEAGETSPSPVTNAWTNQATNEREASD